MNKLQAWKRDTTENSERDTRMKGTNEKPKRVVEVRHERNPSLLKFNGLFASDNTIMELGSTR
jgi:hypothetical protein